MRTYNLCIELMQPFKVHLQGNQRSFFNIFLPGSVKRAKYHKSKVKSKVNSYSNINSLNIPSSSLDFLKIIDALYENEKQKLMRNYSETQRAVIFSNRFPEEGGQPITRARLSII